MLLFLGYLGLDAASYPGDLILHDAFTGGCVHNYVHNPIPECASRNRLAHQSAWDEAGLDGQLASVILITQELVVSRREL